MRTNPLKKFIISVINTGRKQHLDKHHLVNIDCLKMVLQETLAKNWHISYSIVSSLSLLALYLFPFLISMSILS